MLRYKEFDIKGVWRSGRGCFAIDDDWNEVSLVGFPSYRKPFKGDTIGAIVGESREWNGKELYTIEVLVPSFDSCADAQRYFSEGVQLEGVTANAVRNMYRAFGKSFLREFFKYPFLISRVDGLSRAATVSMEAYVRETDMASRIETMYPCLAGRYASIKMPGDVMRNKIPLAQAIFYKHGQESLSILRENPYMLAYDSELKSFTFSVAEQCAMVSGMPAADGVRVVAVMAKAAKMLVSGEDVCGVRVSGQHGGSTVLALPRDDKSNFDSWMKACVFLSQTVGVDRWVPADVFAGHMQAFMDVAQYGVQLIFDEGSWYVTTQYACESRLADAFVEMSHEESMCSVSQQEFDSFMRRFQTGLGYSLHSRQVDAVREALLNRVSIITGGPGRGKTAVMKAIVAGWNEFTGGKKAVVTSFTGKATAHARVGLGDTASMADVSTMCQIVYGGRKDVMQHTLVIVDEATMVAEGLFEQFLSEMEDCQLVLVGDVDQLPSIDSGQVFRDLIESGFFQVTRLTKNQRLSGSGLDKGEMAAINANFFTMLDPEHGSFTWLPNQFEWATHGIDDEAAAKRMESDYLDTLANNGDDFRTVVMLSPLKAASDAFSVMRLNYDVQAMVNPHDGKAKCDGKGYATNIFYGSGLWRTRVRVGDRVMVTKNLHDCGCMNGDVGTLVAYDEYIVIDFDNGDDVVRRSIPGVYGEHIDLAYAMTVHKSQGSDYDHVFIGMSERLGGGWFLGEFMSRNLVYTAATRMKSSVQFYGNQSVFDAVVRSPMHERHTMFPRLLRSAVSC